MNWEIAFVLCLLVASFAAMVWEKWSVDIVALAAMALLLVVGVLSPRDVFSVFSNEATITRARVDSANHLPPGSLNPAGRPEASGPTQNPAAPKPRKQSRAPAESRPPVADKPAETKPAAKPAETPRATAPAAQTPPPPPNVKPTGEVKGLYKLSGDKPPQDG